MSLECYRCGQSLEALSLPFSRLDECPGCGVQLHVCRMCVSFAPSAPEQCTEDDALEVRDKKSANFCDYFKPCGGRFSGEELSAEARARETLGALFGDAPSPGADGEEPRDSDRARAESLFKS